LLVVRYAGDLERKRLEYLMARWGERLSFKRVHGAIVMVEGSHEGVEDFIRELYSRIPRDRIEVYSLERLDIEPPVSRMEKSIVVEDESSAWSVIEFLMRKSKGVLMSDTGDSRRYRVYLRGGVADVEFRMMKRGSSTILNFSIEGYDDHVKEFFRYLERELSYLGGGG